MYLLPNILTCCNLAAGCLAVYFSLSHKIYLACWLVLTCVIFDGLDGWAARRMNKESAFGRIFDSVADFFSFGLAPVFIYHTLTQKKDGPVIPLMLIYILASAIRLIRFTTDNKYQNKDFEGLPTTASAAFLVILILFFKENFGKVIFSAPIFITLSALMLSRVRFLKFNR